VPLIIFYVSCFLAFVAGHMVNYTAILYSLETFDSSTLAGLAYGLCFGPPVVFGWIAGAYIDRYSAKRTLLLAQNGFILGALCVSASIWVAELKLPLLMFGSFCVGVGWAFVAPSRLAALGNYVQGDRLSQATIVFNLLVMIGFGLAPMLLMVLVDWVGWFVSVLIAFGMFVISSLLLLSAPNKHVRHSHDHILREWKDCFAQIGKTPLVVQLLLSAIIGYLLMGPMQVILPQVAEKMLFLDPLEKGRYLGLIALSLIIGGILAMKLKNKVSIGKTILVMLLFCGFSIATLGAIHTLWLSCLVLVLGTASAGLIVSFIVAGLQLNAPDSVRGKVMSMYTIISQVVSAMAGLVAGAVADLWTVPVSLYMIGALFVVLTLGLSARGTQLKQFNKLERVTA